jgi:hypothetical protein
MEDDSKGNNQAQQSTGTNLTMNRPSHSSKQSVEAVQKKYWSEQESPLMTGCEL